MRAKLFFLASALVLNAAAFASAQTPNPIQSAPSEERQLTRDVRGRHGPYRPGRPPRWSGKWQGRYSGYWDHWGHWPGGRWQNPWYGRLRGYPYPWWNRYPSPSPIMPYGRPVGPAGYPHLRDGASYEGGDYGMGEQPFDMYPSLPMPTEGGEGGYAGVPAQEYTDPYAYDPAAYDTDAYAAGYADESIANPYYDTDPVQFAYTPADAPSRAPVVRPDPDRPSSYSLILPRHARNGLYELAAMKSPVDPLASEGVKLSSVVPQ